MGLPPRDFLTRYDFRRYARSERIWSLDFTFAMPLLFSALSDLGRGRQVSTLSSSQRALTVSRPGPKLSSVLQPPSRAAVPPSLTPFTGPFPNPVLNCSSPLRLPVSPPGLRVPAGFYTRRSSPTRVCGFTDVIAQHSRHRMRFMTASTVIGLFRNRRDAECAFDAALARGFEAPNINLVMSDETRTRSFPADRTADTGLADKAAEGAADASGGGVLGGPVGGTVATIAPVVAAVAVATLLPGLGLVLAGPVAAAITAAGAVAVAGGLMGAMANWGIPKERIEVFETGIRDGGILIGVTPHTAEEATEIERLWQACGATYVQQPA